MVVVVVVVIVSVMVLDAHDHEGTIYIQKTEKFHLKSNCWVRALKWRLHNTVLKSRILLFFMKIHFFFFKDEVFVRTTVVLGRAVNLRNKTKNERRVVTVVDSRLPLCHLLWCEL